MLHNIIFYETLQMCVQTAFHRFILYTCHSERSEESQPDRRGSLLRRLQRWSCHSERSEESACGRTRILRCAQNDKQRQARKYGLYIKIRKIRRGIKVDLISYC